MSVLGRNVLWFGVLCVGVSGIGVLGISFRVLECAVLEKCFDSSVIEKGVSWEVYWNSRNWKGV